MVYREVLKKTVRFLKKEKITFVIVGALASGYYGMPRSTRYIDFIVFGEKKAFKKLVTKARKSGFILVGSLHTAGSGNFMLEAKDDGYRADFRAAEDSHDFIAIERRRKARFFATDVWLASPEDLVIQKLRMGRVNDFQDAATIMIRQEGKLDLVYLDSQAREMRLADVFNELKQKVWW